MSTHQSVDRDERTEVVEKAGLVWAYNFLLFALLIDVMYRTWVLRESAWDLLALVVASGAVSWLYLMRHKALSHELKKVVLFAAAIGAVAAVVGIVVNLIQR